MSQRFYLFYSGYTLCAPMRYYNQLMVSEIIEQSNNLSLKEYSNVEVAELESLKLESNTHIETVISIANELKQDVKEKPVSFETYIDWKKNVISVFEENFPMTKIEHYYFLFGRRLSDVIVNIHTLTKLVSVIKFGENGDRIIKKIDKLLKDIEYDLFKMMAPAALVSGEYRHHYFSVYFKEISTLFKPFSELDVKKLNLEELDKLEVDLKQYSYTLIDGFKKCVNLLKELEV